MKRASISDAKNRLSALIDQVRHGDPIVIEDRGVPVARLEPVAASLRGARDGRAARLLRLGLVRPASTPCPHRLIESDPPTPERGAALSQVLIEERRSGR